MAQALYAVDTGTTFTNSLATPAVQTILAFASSATDHGLQLKKYRIGFNGVTASNTPVLCRIYSCTFASNGIGSAGSSQTIKQVAGRAIAATNMTAGSNWPASTEPTVKTYIGEEFSLTPNGGTILYDFPLGDEPDTFNSGGMGFGFEITPAQVVGFSAAMFFTRI